MEAQLLRANTNLKNRKHIVTYVYDDKLASSTNKIPNIRDRARITHELIRSYGLTDQMNWISSEAATFEDLKVFHSSSYVDFLAACNTSEGHQNHGDESDSGSDRTDDEINVDSQEFQNEHKLTDEDFGLGYDCPIFKNMGDFARVIAGGTLTACREILNGNLIAINWCGGWHHAQRDQAGGFCTVNDIVLGCHLLQKKFPKILYIDLDAHHGDGVENAFSLTRNILTFSMHIREPGYYPGTGSIDDIGIGRGKYHVVNVPLKSYVSDYQFFNTFDRVLSSIVDVFHADAVIVQCGVDFISGDPVGKGNLTEKGLGQCVARVMELKLPTLFLGGGGYNQRNSAKCWAYLTSLITGVSISSDIPEHDNFLLFGPDFDLGITASPVKSQNTNEYLDSVVSQIKGNLKNLKDI
ncbi:unnamed protein product [Allacma fusca]|uniref:Histone deacetylase n=1 Tax=Allacma fusca TaxID=39272 RepID=A0A8J2LEJ5_9HEXA|nr:unnamed protein product [Allacma fusca]